MKDAIPSTTMKVLKKKNIENTKDVRSLFEENLKQIYWYEKELSTFLPQMADLATSYELTSAVLGHLAVTENQIIRLIRVFDALGEVAIGVKSQNIQNLIIANKAIPEIASGYFRDTEIIVSVRKIMRHKIASYGLLHELAVKLGEDLASEFLAMAIKEEKNASQRLTDISLSSIYFDAAS
jgi:ferritin-like metal-binding protein YciE